MRSLRSTLASATAIATLLVSFAISTGTASAKVTRPRALAQLTVGFSGAYINVASGNSATDAFWDKKAKSVGTQMIRISVSWSQIAPSTLPAGFNASNPSSSGYDWTGLDEQLREVAAGGFQIVLTIQDAPSWAEGSGMPSSATAGSWKPNATMFGQFAHAIAERYSGNYADPLNPGKVLPRVRYWQAWNEPNLPEYLSPEYQQVGYNFVAVSPGLYRNLENAFYKGVKSISGSNYVVLAGLAPYGDPPANYLGDPTARMHPITFMQDLLCVNSSGKRTGKCPATYFDAADSHVYGMEGPTWTPYWPNDISAATVSRVSSVVQAAVRTGTALPRSTKGYWVGEIGWSTNPPTPGTYAPAQQARWLEQSLYLLWQQKVSTVLWWHLGDSSNPYDPNDFESGVYYYGGAAKPGATAYRFPFVTNRDSRHYVTVWSRSPATGVMSIQKLVQGRWRTIAQALVSTREVTQVRVSLTGQSTLRGTINGITSLSWVQGA